MYAFEGVHGHISMYFGVAIFHPALVYVENAKQKLKK